MTTVIQLIPTKKGVKPVKIIYTSYTPALKVAVPNGAA